MNIVNRIRLIIISIFIGITIGFGQTATNFTSVNCSGTSYDLFTELNQGSVIVLCWVMPCGGCILGAKTSFDVVTSYQSSFPHRVYFYLVDDVGDATCTQLNNWANGPSVVVPETSYSFRFSDSLIKMSDYGIEGMPKIVVLGGNSHSVFLNVNANEGPLIPDSLSAAINNALASPFNVPTFSSDFSNVNLFPVPSNKYSVLSIDIKSVSEVKVELYNSIGNIVNELFNDNLNTGKNVININTSELSNGIYFVKVTVADKNKIIKLVVSD